MPVIDVWVWEAADHHACQIRIDDIRETPMWDRNFEIVETLPGVENAYADNFGRAAMGAWTLGDGIHKSRE